MKSNRKNIMLLISIIVIAVAGYTVLQASSTSEDNVLTKSFQAASDKAYKWILSTSQSNGLYDSQSPADGDACYTYDQSLAVMAFLVKGDKKNAKKLLTKLQKLQNADGSWYNGYSKTDDVVENMKHCGPTLFVVLASAQYKKATAGNEFDAMANKALDWVIKLQQSDGGINGGIEEDGKATWCSTEHNEDAYAAFILWGRTEQAESIKMFLIKSPNPWNKNKMRWDVGRDDARDYCDVQPWGLQSLGVNSDSIKALEYNYNHLLCKITKDGITVEGFDFDWDKSDVWLEGTGEMAAAYFTAGNILLGNKFTGEIIKFQKSNGGVPYSMLGGDTHDEWNMPDVEAISSTAWLIFAVAHYNPFK